MNSHKRVQENRAYTLAMSQYSAAPALGASERLALIELLQGSKGDYNSLHAMTDCVYQISQLITLIQIHLPTEPAMPGTPSSPVVSAPFDIATALLSVQPEVLPLREAIFPCARIRGLKK